MRSEEPKGLGGWIVANLMILGGMALFVVWSFPSLPERYPVHFDINGIPNRWVAGDSKEWFFVLGISALLNAVFIGTGFAIKHTPVGFVNVPHKERFLKLPRERQLDVLMGFGKMLLAMAIGLNLLMLGIYVVLYQVALQRMAFPSVTPMVAVPVLLVLMMLGWTLKISRQIRRECDEHEARQRSGTHRASPNG
jgi:uncharacterized membrane protein